MMEGHEYAMYKPGVLRYNDSKRPKNTNRRTMTND